METIVTNLAIIFGVLAIVAGIVLYLRRAKKRGQTCIGCPYAKQCQKNCTCNQREFPHEKKE